MPYFLKVKMSIYCCSKMYLILILLSVCCTYNVNGRQDDVANTQCVLNGGYCQTHWQCCSRRCMTYSYLCVPPVGGSSYPASEPEKPTNFFNWWYLQSQQPADEQIQIVQLPEEAKPTQTGEKAEFPNSLNTNSIQNPSCLPYGDPCYLSSQCCSRRCHTYANRCVH